MPLELTNLPLTGLQIEQRAVIESGANVGTGNSDIFLFPPRGTSGSVEDGDITIETTELTRVRVQGNGALLSLSDSNLPDALNLSTYFSTGGAGRDLTLYFVTALGMFSIPIENDDGTDGYDDAFGNTIRFDIPDTDIDLGDRFGFDSAGVGFDLARFTPGTYTAQDILRGISNGDRFILAFARPIPRRLIQASRTFGAGSASVDVETRVPSRHAITAAGAFHAHTPTVTVLVRTAVRIAMTLTPVAFVAHAATVAVQARAPPRIAITASGAFGGHTATVPVRIRESARIPITASRSFGSHTSTVQIQSRTVARISIAANRTFDGQSSTARVQVISPARYAITAARAFPAHSAGVTVLVRTSARIAITASRTFGAHSATATVLTLSPVRRPLTAILSFGGHTATAQAQVRPPSRIAVAASTTFASAQSTVAVNLRASPRVEIELHPFVAVAHTATVAVQRIDELQLADFPGTTLTPDWSVLLERSATGTTLYAAAARGGTDTPLDGEIGVSPTEEPITRIRLTNNTTLVINDNGALNLNTYFTGDGDDITLWVMNEARVVQGATVSRIAGVANRFNFAIPSAMGDLLADIEVGERWIFAGTRAGVDARHVIEGDETYPAAVATVAVESRAPVRKAITLAVARFAPQSATASVQVRPPARRIIAASRAFAAHSATVAVQALTPTRAALTLNALVFPAQLSTVAIATRFPARSNVQASKNFHVQTSTVAVQVRTSARHEIRATATFPAATVVQPTVFVRQPVRHSIAADETHPQQSSTVAVETRFPERVNIQSGKTFHAPTSTVSVQVRTAVRHTIQAAATFHYSTVARPTVEIREPVRHEITAGGRLSQHSATVAVGIREATRHPITAGATLPRPHSHGCCPNPYRCPHCPDATRYDVRCS